MFALFAYTGMRVARRSADPFARLVAGAATIWICGQAVINIGYVTALLPVTGIPLPFISAGGTSLLASFFVLGMLVSFARHEAPAVTHGAPRPAPGPALAPAALAAHPGARGRTNRRSDGPRPHADVDLERDRTTRSSASREAPAARASVSELAA